MFYLYRELNNHLHFFIKNSICIFLINYKKNDLLNNLVIFIYNQIKINTILTLSKKEQNTKFLLKII